MANVTIPIFDINNKPRTGCMTKSIPCYVCCSDVKHLHLSTQYYNKQCLLDDDDNPMCYNCMIRHPIDMMTRTRLILTDSTLFGIPFTTQWNDAGAGQFHVDWEAVAGGLWDSLIIAWDKGYWDHALPVDTIAVCGINDIKPIVSSLVDSRVGPINQQVENPEIITKAKDLYMEKVEKLKSKVEAHKKYKNTDDTLAVSRLFRVPALYWGSDDGEYPGINYINYRPIIDAINLDIEAWNANNGSSKVPNLQNTGRRTVGKGARTGFMFNRFREAEHHKKLHFKDEIRADISKRFLKYFEIRAPKIVNFLQ